MTQAAPAQQFLAIDSIRDGTVVLKDGGVRAVLMCSSLNFALKSGDEQDAIIFQYQNFLNALDFPVQFVIHSRRLNIEPYLEALAERQKEEESGLLKTQIAEYGEFIRTFVDATNIMAKSFFVVVPFTPTALEGGRGIGALLSALGLGAKTGAADERAFEEYRRQLLQRVDTVLEGLQRFGIRAAPLNTEELIELFYGLYNPTEFEKVTAPAETGL